MNNMLSSFKYSAFRYLWLGQVTHAAGMWIDMVTLPLMVISLFDTLEEAAINIENGVNISTALKETGEFPPILIQLLATGEETGEIDGLALKASDFYTKQVNAIVDRLTSIIEPLLIVLVGAVIGVIVIVTYLPIFHFGEALAK